MTTAITEVKLPDGIDYCAYYEVEIPPEVPYDTGFVHCWEDALLYNTGDIREFLINGGLYHQRITDTFLVAYNFHFEIDEKNRIVAQGIVHPATQHRDDYHTDESVIMSNATVVIKPTEPAADVALRRYIRVHCMNQLPNDVRGFGMPADQSCHQCPVNWGVPPVMQCPACGDTFCDSCTDMTAWHKDHNPECPTCGHRPMAA